MNIYYTDSFVLPLPPGHRFPMQKYALLRERLLANGSDGARLLVPPAAQDEDLCRVHDAGYVQAVSNGTLDAASMRRIGFPWSAAMVERSRRSVGATMAATRAALESGYAASLAGGTHHAFAERGEGFCVFNDVAVAVRCVQAERKLRRVVVVDLDVHQGNGTAALFRNDDDVYTFSVHGANNFPFHKEVSDLDIALPDGTGDERFLSAVAEGLARAMNGSCDVVYYVAGADPFQGDRLGRLSVSKAALAERDRLVYDACARSGAAVVIVMGGGYAEQVEDTVDIHLHSVREALRRCNSTVSTSR